jgi:chorismate mutase
MSIEDWRAKSMRSTTGSLNCSTSDRSAIEVERSTCGEPPRAIRRGREILQRIKKLNVGPLDDEGLQRLFERVIDECRRIERIEREKED